MSLNLEAFSPETIKRLEEFVDYLKGIKSGWVIEGYMPLNEGWEDAIKYKLLDFPMVGYAVRALKIDQEDPTKKEYYPFYSWNTFYKDLGNAEEFLWVMAEDYLNNEQLPMGARLEKVKIWPNGLITVLENIAEWIITPETYQRTEKRRKGE